MGLGGHILDWGWILPKKKAEDRQAITFDNRCWAEATNPLPLLHAAVSLHLETLSVLVAPTYRRTLSEGSKDAAANVPNIIKIRHAEYGWSVDDLTGVFQIDKSIQSLGISGFPMIGAVLLPAPEFR